MSLPVPDKLLQTVNLNATLLLLDCICAATVKDPKHDARLVSAEARLEEIIGAYLTRPGTRGAVLPAAARFEAAESAYLRGIQALTLAFDWRTDTRGGPAYNFWNDLSSVLHRSYVRCHHDNA